ncbi:MAG: pyruvate ferredoxin oxidoreductase [Candidatus Adiutrix intracellularis]|nr:pyruvate ferredoxin oxidoreductase [Candidatus Adiutrix intracellularis]
MSSINSTKPVGIEVSLAIAEAVKLAEVEVVAAYPITPQTHIVEHLSDLVANGELNAEYVPVESEHSALSACIGSSAAGARTFTSTSSQGLMLMAEIVFIAPMLRMPIVMAVANRAISGPLNIWNDHSDVMSIRDCGWIQIFAETGQEATDLSIIAFRIAEDKNVMMPLILNLDGFTLSHFIEPIIFPEADKVKKFLPPYETSHKLDLNNPLSFGLLGGPEVYTEARRDTDLALLNSRSHVQRIFDEFAGAFGRQYRLVETYKTEGAETIIVTIGSISETAMSAVDEMRAVGEKVGLIHIRLWRPFPVVEFRAAVAGAKNLAVVDRHISMGFPEGPVGTEVRALMYHEKERPRISNYVLGLGGRDVTRNHFKYIVEQVKSLGADKRQGGYEMVGVLE